MSTMQWIMLCFGYISCLGLSFFLSGMETGLAELSRLRLRRKAREGNANAGRLQNIVDHPEDMLWTILVGNTLANLFVFLSSLFFLQQLMGIHSPEETLIHLNGISLAYWLLFTLFALLFYTLCELLPKMIFRKYPDQLCLYLSHLFALVNLVFSPLVNLLRGVSRLILFITGGREMQDHLFSSREELRQMMTDSSQNMTEDEREMIDRVLDLQKIPVRDLAVPFENLPEITSEMSVAELIQEHSAETNIRIPVWQVSGERRRIVGVINLRRLIFMPESEWHRPVGHFLESALYQDEDIRLQKLLQLMQRSGQRAVIILNKRKQELGIVSLPDILNVIFGKVRVK